MTAGVYQIRNLINNKIYIGSTVNLNRRKCNHYSDLRRNCHSNCNLQVDYTLYGKENFVFEELLTCDPTMCTWYEDQFIKQWNPEYNVYPAIGGGFKRSAESKKKQSDSIKKLATWGSRPKGTKMPKEFGESVRKGKLGKPMPESQKEAIRLGHLGRTDEQKKLTSGKIKESVRKNWEKRKNGAVPQ